MGVRCGWSLCVAFRLNPNATIRNAASTRAAQLSDVLLQISKNSTFKHFDTAYTPFPLAQIAQQWEQRGGQAADLIEPIDGFHPSQIGHYLIVRCHSTPTDTFCCRTREREALAH